MRFSVSVPVLSLAITVVDLILERVCERGLLLMESGLDACPENVVPF